jgi:hypothetical protein
MRRSKDEDFEEKGYTGTITQRNKVFDTRSGHSRPNTIDKRSHSFEERGNKSDAVENRSLDSLLDFVLQCNKVLGDLFHRPNGLTNYHDLVVDILGDTLHPRGDELHVLENGKSTGRHFFQVLIDIRQDLSDTQQHHDEIDAQRGQTEESQYLRNDEK